MNSVNQFTFNIIMTGVISTHIRRRQLFMLITRSQSCWPYTRIGIGQYQLEISLCRYGFDIIHHIGFLGVSRGQLLKSQKFIPLTCILDTDGITHSIECHLRTRCIETLDRSGKALRGFQGHLPVLGRQLQEIDIKIRFIVHLFQLWSILLLIKIIGTGAVWIKIMLSLLRWKCI